MYEIADDIKKILKNECDEFEVYIEESKNIELDSLKDELNFAKEEIELGVGIRVIKDNRQGFAFTTNINQLEKTGLQAVENSKLSKKDKNYAFSEVKKVKDVKKIYDEKINDLNLDDTCAFLNDFIKKAGDNRCEVTGAGFNASENKTLISNSNDVLIENNETGYGLSLSVTIKKNGEIATAYNSQTSRFFDIDSDKLVNEVCDLAKNSLNSKPIETDDYDVVLDYYASTGLLQTFLAAFNGENVYRGRSILKDKLGEEIANPALSIIDNPLLEKGLGSAKCDGEGSVSQKTDLIKDGILKSFLYNIYTAKTVGCETTSNAMRYNYLSTPQIGPSNLEFKFSKNIEFEEIRHGILTTSVLGAHTANPISGDFSVEASNAFKIENGEISDSINKAMISGNIFEIMKNIEGLKSEIKQYGSYIIPKMLVHDLRVVGQG